MLHRSEKAISADLDLTEGHAAAFIEAFRCQAGKLPLQHVKLLRVAVDDAPVARWAIAAEQMALGILAIGCPKVQVSRLEQNPIHISTPCCCLCSEVDLGRRVSICARTQCSLRCDG